MEEMKAKMARLEVENAALKVKDVTAPSKDVL
jgi:hypothetical protein